MTLGDPEAAMALAGRPPEDEEGPASEPEEALLLGPFPGPARVRRRGPALRAVVAVASAGLALLVLLRCSAWRRRGSVRLQGLIGESDSRAGLPNATSDQEMADLKRKWQKMAQGAAGDWTRTMEGEWKGEVKNATKTLTQQMHDKWSLITGNASRGWTQILRDEWRKTLRNATSWARKAETGWDQSLENSSGWTRTMDSWWQHLQKSQEFQETLDREKYWQQQLKQGLTHRLGSLTNETGEMERVMLKQQMRHALSQGMGAVGNITLQAHAWRKDIKSLMRAKNFLNGSSKARCPDLDGLYIERVLHTNLGGKGPQQGEHSLVFASNHSEGGVTVKRLAFKITSTSPYTPGWNAMNGLSHGIVGKYGQVTIKPGTNVSLRIQTLDLDSGKPIHMPSFAFTFFDLDEAQRHEASEFVNARGFKHFEVTPETEVRRKPNPDGSTTFQASTPGTYDDNPVDPLLLTEQQKNRAVTLRFGAVDEITVVIGATPSPSDPGTWRCFTFVAHPVLKCAKTLGQKAKPTGPSQLVLLGAGVVCLLLAVCIGCLCCCL